MAMAAKLPTIDIDIFAEDKILKKFSKFLHQKNYDINANFACTRQILSTFVEGTYGLKLTKIMLTEAIFSCRGKELEGGDSKLYN